MDTILALCEKRKNLWDAAKAFLDMARDENGMVSAEDAARYDKMEEDVVNLGKEIDRLERQQQLDAQLAQPTSSPITEQPGAGNQVPEKKGRASLAYQKAFWDSIRHKNFIDVQNALSVGTDADGGYLVPDEFEHQLIDKLQEENFFRSLATVIHTSGDRKIPVVTGHGEASWMEENGLYPDSQDTFGQQSIGAYKLGTAIRVPAIAITDHGVVQSFADADHAIKDDNFKVIYGCEAYLVDDLDDTVVNEEGQTLQDSFVVFDLETTGFSPTRNRIIEIGAVKVEKGKITDRFSTFVNPEVAIPPRITDVTSITDDMVSDAPKIETILPEFLDFCKGCVLVAHNAGFDYSFICKKGAEQGRDIHYTVVDTVGVARVLFPHLAKYTLDNVAKTMKISLVNHHRAVEDAEATAEIFEKMIRMLEKQGITDLKALYERTHSAPEIIKKKPSYHAIILAKNEVGRVNLYHLVSMAHLDYYARRPRIPKSQLMKYREGLILGSACEAGELYRALLDDADEERIEELVDFYDYLEIQPIGNNEFMFDKEKGAYANINT